MSSRPIASAHHQRAARQGRQRALQVHHGARRRSEGAGRLGRPALTSQNLQGAQFVAAQSLPVARVPTE